ncbi:MAG: AzlC family ABC transporter permease, partial [Sphaerochaetaceae bacterium]|nr:AzlC family ABC transporter permease [Sphaerochaetaceae bacterium]
MRELKFAIKHTIPIFFTYLFIGIAFGMLMNDSGYGIFWTLLSALFIYAGSMQLVMVPLLSSGASIPTLILMTIFINARHIFYGIGFVERFQKRGILYPYMVFSLTDETYSILCSVEYEEGIDEKWADFFIAFLNHCYWIVGCFIGAYTGRAFGIDTAGIDFSATALFIVVVVDQIRRYRTKLPF